MQVPLDPSRVLLLGTYGSSGGTPYREEPRLARVGPLGWSAALDLLGIVEPRDVRVYTEFQSDEAPDFPGAFTFPLMFAVPDTRAPVLRVEAAPRSLDTALRRGVPLGVALSEPGQVCLSLELGVSAAREVGLRPTAEELRRRSVALAFRCVAFGVPGGNRRLTVSFNRRAKRALVRRTARRGPLPVIVRALATDAAGNRTATQRRLRLGR